MLHDSCTRKKVKFQALLLLSALAEQRIIMQSVHSELELVAASAAAAAAAVAFNQH
jgi:hypothetical protein